LSEPVCHCTQTDRKARRAEIEDKLVVYKQRKAELTSRFQSCAVGERAEIRAELCRLLQQRNQDVVEHKRIDKQHETALKYFKENYRNYPAEQSSHTTVTSSSSSSSSFPEILEVLSSCRSSSARPKVSRSPEPEVVFSSCTPRPRMSRNVLFMRRDAVLATDRFGSCSLSLHSL